MHEKMEIRFDGHTHTLHIDMNDRTLDATFTGEFVIKTSINASTRRTNFITDRHTNITTMTLWPAHISSITFVDAREYDPLYTQLFAIKQLQHKIFFALANGDTK